MGIMTPFLMLPPLAAVVIVAFIAALIINIAYKYMTDQKLMKQLKDDINKLQKEAKGAAPEKAMSLQKKALEVNMEYFKHSLKPTIVTMIPVLLIFIWMSAHYSYASLKPGTEFTTTVITEQGANGEIELLQQEGIEIIGESRKKIENSNATFALKGKEGEYLLEYAFEDKKYSKEAIIAKEQRYAEQAEKISGDSIREIRINYMKNEMLDLFGWKIGWLGTYIIFSIIFSLAIRKAMNLY